MRANPVNALEFSDRRSELRARGFDEKGFRNGGIIAPAKVTLRPGGMLIRFFGDQARADGSWWFTPHELWLLREYLGHEDFATGRATAGDGVLHKSGVVLKQKWSSPMDRFRVAKINASLLAYHGEGDGASVRHEPSGGVTETYLKGLKIFNTRGRQRYVRQVFIPGQSNHSRSLTDQWKGYTDSGFAHVLRDLSHTPYSFES